MKCAASHDEMVAKIGELDLRIGGRLLLVRNVSYEECLSCGEKVLSPAVSLDLYNEIERGDYAEQTVNIPVLYGAHGAEGHESTPGSPQ
jgi:YgiT-type zinc finger domain-containing protein